MAVSNNSIIHYTRSPDTLLAILKERKFRLKYCSEKVGVLRDKQVAYFDIAVPVVSFCDIPFTEIGVHLTSYGEYGIGLSKDWARRQSLNPVLYIYENSGATGALDSLSYLVSKVKRDLADEDDASRQIARKLDEGIVRLLGYVKNYSGELERQKNPNYRFYNEREWRFVARQDQGLEIITDGSEYRTRKSEINKKAWQKYVEFEESDINYIVLSKKVEIRPFIDSLCTICGFRSDNLHGKILTVEQLVSDF